MFPSLCPAIFTCPLSDLAADKHLLLPYSVSSLTLSSSSNYLTYFIFLFISLTVISLVLLLLPLCATILTWFNDLSIDMVVSFPFFNVFSLALFSSFNYFITILHFLSLSLFCCFLLYIQRYLPSLLKDYWQILAYSSSSALFFYFTYFTVILHSLSLSSFWCSLPYAQLFSLVF